MLLVVPDENPDNFDADVLHNMSAPPQHVVEAVRKPVFGLKLIDLGRCLKLNDSSIIEDSASLQPAERFWEELQDRHGITQDSINARASSWRGFLAGRTYYKVQADSPDVQLLDRIPVCPDIELTVAILARLVGSLFQPRREPDYGLGHLQGHKFMVDDSRVPAVEPVTLKKQKPVKTPKK